MKRPLAALLIVSVAVSAVAVARRAPGPLAAGVPSYRMKGSSRARAVVVVFSDFQCPNCARAEPLVQALLDRHPKDVRVYFRHNPLPRMHPWALPAARAAEAAGRQGKFWEYAAILFQRQKDWSGPAGPGQLFAGYAEETGLDVDKFLEDLQGDRWDGPLQADAEASRSAGVGSTPTIFINDHRLVGASQLEAEGERLVQEAKR